MNWLAVISLFIKYGPPVAAFVKQEEPNIQAFIKDVEAAFGGTAAAPDLGAVFGQFLAALHAGTPPGAAAGAVLQGQTFSYPPLSTSLGPVTPFTS